MLMRITNTRLCLPNYNGVYRYIRPCMSITNDTNVWSITYY